MNEIYTTREAARFLRMSVPTLKDISRDSLPYSEVGKGRRRRYQSDDMRRYLELTKQEEATQ